MVRPLAATPDEELDEELDEAELEEDDDELDAEEALEVDDDELPPALVPPMQPASVSPNTAITYLDVFKHSPRGHCITTFLSDCFIKGPMIGVDDLFVCVRK